MKITERTLGLYIYLSSSVQMFVTSVMICPKYITPSLKKTEKRLVVPPTEPFDQPLLL